MNEEQREGDSQEGKERERGGKRRRKKKLSEMEAFKVDPTRFNPNAQGSPDGVKNPNKSWHERSKRIIRPWCRPTTSRLLRSERMEAGRCRLLWKVRKPPWPGLVDNTRGYDLLITAYAPLESSEVEFKRIQAKLGSLLCATRIEKNGKNGWCNISMRTSHRILRS